MIQNFAKSYSMITASQTKQKIFFTDCLSYKADAVRNYKPKCTDLFLFKQSFELRHPFLQRHISPLSCRLDLGLDGGLLAGADPLLLLLYEGDVGISILSASFDRSFINLKIKTICLKKNH